MPPAVRAGGAGARDEDRIEPLPRRLADERHREHEDDGAERRAERALQMDLAGNGVHGVPPRGSLGASDRRRRTIADGIAPI
jgi:hypothetical protein